MLQANPCWQGALEASLERGRLCVREHLIEKEVCYVQIPETVYALVAQPVQPRVRGVCRLCCCRGGATKRSPQGVEARLCRLLFRCGSHVWRLGEEHRRVAGG